MGETIPHQISASISRRRNIRYKR